MGSKLEKQSGLIRKQIERHTFNDELGEEYEGSKFGGFSDYFRRKRLKLQNLDAHIRSNSSDKPQIFRGIVIYVNGYTQPSLNDIHHIVVSHGGGFCQYLDGKTTVTHIIAANLTPKKAIEFRKYRIVKPAWIVDSVAAGKILPWTAYKILDEGPAQRLLGFEEGKISSHKNENTRSYSEQTESSWYTGQLKKIVDNIVNESGPKYVEPKGFTKEKLEESVNDDKIQVKSEPHLNDIDNNSLLSEGFEVTSSLEEVLDGTEDLRFHSEQIEITDVAHVDSCVQTPSSPLHPSSDIKTHQLVSSQESSLPPKEKFHTQIKTQSVETGNNPILKKSRELTAEEHNSILLTDPKIRQSTTANPDFISQFYAESRLHHLSAWKAELKSRLQAMASEKSQPRNKLSKNKTGARRYIMHIDFDSFFCAVSLKNSPEFVDQPAAVAHGSGAGAEIASCNYPARAFGVKNGMWMKNALKLCPQIKVLPYDFPAYEAASNLFYKEILSVGGIVQSVSVDEALVDITSLCYTAGQIDGIISHEESILCEQEKANTIASDLKKRVKKMTGCEVSIGIGPNIFLAKVALRKSKPAGLLQIKPKDVVDHICQLNVTDLPGVARSIGGKLEKIGIKSVKDIRQSNEDRLMVVLGPKTGKRIWEFSQGVDLTEVGEQVCRKSVSAEINWGIRFITQNEAEEFLYNLCIELQRRLVDQKVRGKQLTVKIMRRSRGAPLDPPKHLGHGICDTFNKSVIFGVATSNAELIGREAVSILRSYGFSPGDLRGLGVQMTKLDIVKTTHRISPIYRQKGNCNGTPIFLNRAPLSSIDPHHEIQTSKKQKTILGPYKNPNSESVEEITYNSTTLNFSKSDIHSESEKDPIDESSPLKTRATHLHPASAIARINSDTKFSPKPLNITGTQFIIPSQIDYSVLGELPQDIQSKLLAQSKFQKTSKNSSTVKPQTHNPSKQDFTSLPSGLDRNVFDALPDDMKCEILANYNAHTPDTPSKNRTILKPITKKHSPSKKRGRTRNLGLKTKHDPRQLNFFSFLENNKGQFNYEQVKFEENFQVELDPEFLSELPDDVRLELLDEQKRLQQQKQQRSNSCFLNTIHAANKKCLAEQAPLPRKLILPERESRPTFTTHELSSLPQLRETTSAWYAECDSDGPHPEDVAAMVRYLRRVVIDERDMAKVVGLIRWLDYLITEGCSCNNDSGNSCSCDSKKNSSRNAWISAHNIIKDSIQLAVRERGLGKLDF
ncbi:DNA repair protein REV1 [Erysiphe neolycopersici]|uniref:DNA repair protein REV1 n=1 Tax=Erysiphe neolycopersici TaxID=212602 RepID=A0A420I5V9_9PEZI|nr:DNA repair protein REV1 [Erysiphe neolycopersici]